MAPQQTCPKYSPPSAVGRMFFDRPLMNDRYHSDGWPSGNHAASEANYKMVSATTLSGQLMFCTKAELRREAMLVLGVSREELRLSLDQSN